MQTCPSLLKKNRDGCNSPRMSGSPSHPARSDEVPPQSATDGPLSSRNCTEGLTSASAPGPTRGRSLRRPSESVTSPALKSAKMVPHATSDSYSSSRASSTDSSVNSVTCPSRGSASSVAGWQRLMEDEDDWADGVAVDDVAVVEEPRRVQSPSTSMSDVPFDDGEYELIEDIDLPHKQPLPSEPLVHLPRDLPIRPPPIIIQPPRPQLPKLTMVASAAQMSNQCSKPVVGPSWHCSICRKTACDKPTATLCGHIFCRSCIVRELAADLRCPVCARAVLVPMDVDVESAQR